MKSRISSLPDFTIWLIRENPGCTYWFIKPLIKPSPQRGPTCGIVAANYIMKLWHVANPVYSWLPEKKGDVQPKATTSLRSLYKQAGISGTGGIFDTEQFKLLLNPANYDAETVLFESQAEMSQILLNNLMRNRPVIISCDTSGEDEYDKSVNGKGKKIIGTNGSGEHPHYVTIVGYYKTENGNIHYIFASWSEWLQVSESDLFLSSNSLNIFPGCTEYKLEHSWVEDLPKELPEDTIQKLDKFITPPTDLSKIRNRCILITPKSFDDIAHYTKSLSNALRVNYPLNIDVIKVFIQSGARIDKKDVESWIIIPKDIAPESIIKTATLINQLMRFIIKKDDWNEHVRTEFTKLMKNNLVRLNTEIDGASTLLHRAVLADNYEVIPDLIQYGIDADVNVPGRQQKTPLHYAVRKNIRTLNCLLKQEKINVNPVDSSYSQTPLFDALLTDRPDIVLSLLEAGADVNAKDIFQYTPFYYAVVNHKSEIVRCFIEHKSAYLLELSFNGESILHVAAKTGDVSVMSILLKKYKNRLYEKDGLGNTLLHAAALEGKLDMIKYLITEHQFDVNSRNLKGETILNYYIKQHQNTNEITWLIEHGIEINYIDHKVSTILMKPFIASPIHTTQTLPVKEKEKLSIKSETEQTNINLTVSHLGIIFKKNPDSIGWQLEVLNKQQDCKYSMFFSIKESINKIQKYLQENDIPAFIEFIETKGTSAKIISQYLQQEIMDLKLNRLNL